jgi:hypothetical protein
MPSHRPYYYRQLRDNLTAWPGKTFSPGRTLMPPARRREDASGGVTGGACRPVPPARRQFPGHDRSATDAPAALVRAFAPSKQWRRT